MFADFVDGDDVRMVELGDGFGLGAEAAAVHLAGKQAGGDDFQGDFAFQARDRKSVV